MRKVAALSLVRERHCPQKIPGTPWGCPELLAHRHLVTRLHICVLCARLVTEAPKFIFYIPGLHKGCSHIHHVHKTDGHFCIVTVVFRATATDPNTENTQRLFGDTFGALKIINGLWLPLPSEMCFSQSALATGK